MQPTPGKPYPLGATLLDGGVNFSVFSRNATGMDLLFFDRVDDRQPSHTIRFNPGVNRTYHYWHLFVPGVGSGQIYGFRAQGPFDPSQGMRFDSSKVLLDPYGRGVVIPAQYTRDAVHRPGDDAGTAMKSIVIDCSEYDWEGDVPRRRPASKTIVYEMHVRGFTRHPSSGVDEQKQGTFAGLV